MLEDDDLTLRGNQRAKYFEDPQYIRWSDVILRNNHSYGARTERAFLAQYLSQDEDKSSSITEHVVSQHLDDKSVNWRAVYEYLDERDKTTPSWLASEVKEIHKILDPLREELAPSVEYAAF